MAEQAEELAILQKAATYFAQRLVYVVSAADKDKHASAVPPTLRQRCPRAAFTRSKQRYGAPRLTDELRAQGYPFNVKTVAASLRRQGLRAKASRKFTYRKL
ncbi:hypothetical protein AJR28_002840, partial [Shigella flexneri]